MDTATTMTFPPLINLLYGGKWALVNAAAHDSPVDVVPVQDFADGSANLEFCSRCWKIADEGSGNGLNICSHHSPHLALYAGSPVMAMEGDRACVGHHWLFKFLHPGLGVKSEFHLMSSSDDKYLVVNEKTGMVVLQCEEPNELWTLRDVIGFIGAEEDPLEGRANSELHDDGGFRVFSGDVSLAFHHLHDPEGLSRQIISMSDLMADHIMLGEVDVMPEGRCFKISAVLWELFSSGSNFMNRYQTRRNAEGLAWFPPAFTEQCPFGGVCSLRCRIPMPVIGRKLYTETARVALCHQDGVVTLAYQISGRISVGMLVGEVRTDTLYFFTKPAGNSLKLKCLIKSPPGFFGAKGVEGARQALTDFSDTVREFLGELPENKKHCDILSADSFWV